MKWVEQLLVKSFFCFNDFWQTLFSKNRPYFWWFSTKLCNISSQNPLSTFIGLQKSINFIWKPANFHNRHHTSIYIVWPEKLKKVELDCPKVLCPLWIAPSCPELFNYSLDLKKVEGFKAFKALTWKKLKTKFLPWIDLTRKLKYLQGLELKKPELQGNSNRELELQA